MRKIENMPTKESIIENIFVSYFASGKKDPDGSPYYEVFVKSISNQNHHIGAEVHFKSGYTYCCGELTCHFKPNWNRIRELAKNSGLVLSETLSIELEVFVEKGAKFNVHKAIGIPSESEAYRYIEVFSEKVNA
jgi:hypothetical protein